MQILILQPWVLHLFLRSTWVMPDAPGPGAMLSLSSKGLDEGSRRAPMQQIKGINHRQRKN